MKKITFNLKCSFNKSLELSEFWRYIKEARKRNLNYHPRNLFLFIVGFCFIFLDYGTTPIILLQRIKETEKCLANFLHVNIC